MLKDYEWFLVFVGIVFISLFVLDFLKEFFRGCLLYLTPRIFKQDLKRYGEWAVVTGGSSGIGKDTAYQLARLGMKIVLVSNELEELQTTVEDIKDKFGTECYYIMTDFTNGKEAYDYLWNKIENQDVGIFMNCAGIDGKSPCQFLDETEKNILTMINLHIQTVVNMTYRVTNNYIKKKKGVVVNVSSMASFFPCPYFATYSSSKRFVDFFTQAINLELKERGIKLQSLTPFFVNTRMGHNKPYIQKFGIFLPYCETYCKSWIMALGKCQSFTGYWLHEVLAYGFRFLPRFMCNLGFCIMYNEALKLEEEKQKNSSSKSSDDL